MLRRAPAMKASAPFETEIAELIWDSRYRYRVDGAVGDRELQDTWRRVAQALAGQERKERHEWERRFFSLLQDFRFLPGGRILAGAGTQNRKRKKAIKPD